MPCELKLRSRCPAGRSSVFVVNVCVLLSAQCQLEADAGIQCADYVQAWFFDKDIGACSPFWYGGCGGNTNRFNTENECFRTCGSHSKSWLHMYCTDHKPAESLTSVHLSVTLRLWLTLFMSTSNFLCSSVCLSVCLHHKPLPCTDRRHPDAQTTALCPTCRESDFEKEQLYASEVRLHAHNKYIELEIIRIRNLCAQKTQEK